MTSRFLVLASLFAVSAVAQDARLGQGWLAEFDIAASQILALAEATPEAQYAWRPAPGIRTTSEIYMHVAVGNYWLLGQTGARPPVELGELKGNPEKLVTKKADVVKWLNNSLDAVRVTYAKADRTKAVTFFGKSTTADSVFLRILVHNHEHMGQAIAYARSSGVVPPWSKSAAKE